MNPLSHAIDRRQIRVTITTEDRTTEAVIFPLWHEAEHAPGVPHERPDVWRVLFRHVGQGATWRPGHIRADECEVVEVDPVQMPADIVTTNLPGSLQRAEMLCVFARFGVPIRFAYDKGQGVYESRHGTPLGFRTGKDGLLLVLADADRDGATRSFKLGAVSGILALAAIPTWIEGVGWMASKVAPVSATEAPASEADVDRRQS